MQEVSDVYYMKMQSGACNEPRFLIKQTRVVILMRNSGYEIKMMDKMQLNSTEQREEWFLGALSEGEIPIERMLEVVNMQAQSGDVECADGWCDLLIDELAGRGDRLAAMRVVVLRAGIRGWDDNARNMCKECALRVFSDRLGKAMVESSGFDEKIETVECLRRLDVLSRLKTGRLCYEKTWGFGSVQRVDEFYKKVTIDFSKKSGHQMSFAYAAESLTLLEDDHLFAIQYREPEKLAAMVSDNPSEVAKLALRSLGEMSAVELEECLVNHEIVTAAGWKSFWDKARKGLKADPLIEVPGKRSEAIRLLDVAKAHDDAWFGAFLKELDVDKLLRLLEELIAEVDLNGLNEIAKEAIADRISFAVKADDNSNPGRLAHTIILSESFDPDDEWTGRGKMVESFLNAGTFIKSASAVPARYLQRFINFVARYDEERFRGVVLGSLSKMPLAVLNAVMDYLIESGRRQDIIESLTAAFNKRKVAPCLLLWLGRRDDILTTDQVLSFYNLLIQSLVSVEGTYTGMQLKLRNQLAALLEQGEWLQSILEKLTAGQREDILKRVKTQSGLETASQRSIMGRIVKMYPELERVLVSGSEKTKEPVSLGHYTSYRSYREKQELLKKVVNVDIPANSRDIGIARSYGDLRENGEYETAKQNQSILMKRKDELEQDLVRVQGSDFSQFPVDRVGMGTSVKLEGPSGEIKTINILGEWDSDETLSIISSRSRLAELLAGSVVGDEIELPTKDGSGLHKVLEVSGLSDEIKAWIKVQ